MPDYSFIQGFDRTQLYEHFFWTEAPSLAVINPPVDTDGFRAAFPYFDIISQWVMNVFSGNTSLQEKEAMHRRKGVAEVIENLDGVFCILIHHFNDLLIGRSIQSGPARFYCKKNMDIFVSDKISDIKFLNPDMTFSLNIKIA